MSSTEDGRRALEFYSEVIKEYLIPSQVLPYLVSLLSESESRQILEKYSDQEACECLISVLVRCSHPGWYRCFLQALRLAEFDLLADIIEGHADIKNQAVFKNLLKVFYPNFCEDLNPCDIIPHLLQLKCITDADVDYIRTVYNTRGRHTATMVLLPMVAMKQSAWFPHLMHTLKDTGYGHLVEPIAQEFMTQDDIDGANFVATKIEESVSRNGKGDDDRYISHDALKRMHSMPDLLSSGLTDDYQYSYPYIDIYRLQIKPPSPAAIRDNSSELFDSRPANKSVYSTVGLDDPDEAFDEVDALEPSSREVDQIPEPTAKGFTSEPIITAQSASTDAHKHCFHHSQSYPSGTSRVCCSVEKDSSYPVHSDQHPYYNTIPDHLRRGTPCSQCSKTYYNVFHGSGLRRPKRTSESGSAEDLHHNGYIDTTVFSNSQHPWAHHHSYYNVHSLVDPRKQQVSDHRSKWVPRPPRPLPRINQAACRTQNGFTKQTSVADLNTPVKAPVAPPRRKPNDKRPVTETRPRETKGHDPRRKGVRKSEEQEYAENLRYIIDDSATAEERHLFEALRI